MNDESSIGCEDAVGTGDRETSWGSARHTYLTMEPPSSDRRRSGGIPLRTLLAPGKKLGDRFEIEECLHDGKLGGVFRARNLATRTVVALKIIRVNREISNKVLDLLVNEFHLCSKVTNIKHVLRIQDPQPVAFGDLALIVMPMEFADGGSLRDWLKRDPEEDVRIRTGIAKFKQVCSGVQAIHDMGYVHLDLKPENLLEVHGTMKVADFGIGRCAVGSLSRVPDVLQHGIVGTPEYMSPEQFEHVRLKDVSFASDIYSLGVILFEILDGSQPFQGSIERLKALHLHENAPSVPQSCRQWAPIVQRCLRKNASERYSSVTALLRDVERVERGKAPGVDMACPSCRHLNPIEGEEAWTTTCLKCGKSLPAEFFRSCPRCHVPVRRDLDECPCCHHDVAAHFRKEELTSDLAAAKQEDPDRALTILRRILSERLVPLTEELAKDLEALQEQSHRVRSLSLSADSHVSNGSVEQAIADWRRVAEMFPRHRRALEQTGLLTRLLSEETSAVRRATDAMDRGDFSDAETWLRDTLKALPRRAAPAQLLAACRERAAKYSSALRAAKAAKKRKALHEAAAKVQEALLCAPASKECLLLQKQVSEALGYGGGLVTKAQAHTDAAEFDEAEAAIAAIIAEQADNPSVGSLMARLEKVRYGYQQSMPQAIEAEAHRDLQSAAAKVQEALGFCPNARLAQSLRDSIRTDMQRATDLVEEARQRIPAACFAEAERRLKEAATLWPSAPNIAEVTNAAASSRPRYEAARASAERAVQERDLATAVSFIESAISICPQSGEMIDLMGKVRRDQAEVERLVDAAEEAVRHADFPHARQQLSLACDRWSRNERASALGSRIDTMEIAYRRDVDSARRCLRWRLLARSEEACRRALAVCPAAYDPVEVLNAIAQRRSRLTIHNWDWGAILYIGVAIAIVATVVALVWWGAHRWMNRSTAGKASTTQTRQLEPASRKDLPPLDRIRNLSGVEKQADVLKDFVSKAAAAGNTIVMSPSDARNLEAAVAAVANEIERNIKTYWRDGPRKFRGRRRDEREYPYMEAKREFFASAVETLTPVLRDMAKSKSIPLLIIEHSDWQWVCGVQAYCVSLPLHPKWVENSVLHGDMLDFGSYRRAWMHGPSPEGDLFVGSFEDFDGSVSAFSGNIKMLKVSSDRAQRLLANGGKAQLDILIVPIIEVQKTRQKDGLRNIPAVSYGFYVGRVRLRSSGQPKPLLDRDWWYLDKECEDGDSTWTWAMHWFGGPKLIPPWPEKVPDL